MIPSDIVEAAVSNRQGVILYGPPGTGKSWEARRILKRIGDPVRIYLTPGTLAADLIGGVLPDPNNPGSWRIGPGPLAQAIRDDQPVILEEIGRASGEALAALLGVLDGAPSVSLPDGREIHRPSPLRAIATSNDPPDSLEPALLDRLPVRIHVPEPHPGLIEHVLTDGPWTETGARAIAEAVSAGYRAAASGELPEPPLTFRELQAWVKLTGSHLNRDPWDVLPYISGPTRAEAFKASALAGVREPEGSSDAEPAE